MVIIFYQVGITCVSTWMFLFSFVQISISCLKKMLHTILSVFLKRNTHKSKLVLNLKNAAEFRQNTHSRNSVEKIYPSLVDEDHTKSFEKFPSVNNRFDRLRSFIGRINSREILKYLFHCVKDLQTWPEWQRNIKNDLFISSNLKICR